MLARPGEKGRFALGAGMTFALLVAALAVVAWSLLSLAVAALSSVVGESARSFRALAAAVALAVLAVGLTFEAGRALGRDQAEEARP